MFRRHAFRASRRTAYSMASAGAVAGTVMVETSGLNEDENAQNTHVDTVSNSPPPAAEADAVLTPSVAVEPVNERLPDSVNESSRMAFPDLPEKLSVYPSPTPTLVLLDSPSPLELHIGRVRREVCGYYSGARTQVQGVIDRWIRVEEAVESRLKSFRDPTEPLNPGLLYTGISTLTASVLVRSRSLPVRFLFPPLSFIGAFAYFLPRTAGRVGSWVEELESQYAPRVGEIRRTSVAHTSMTLSMLEDKYRQGKEGLGKGAVSVVEGLESSTGLRLSSALGWTSETGAADDKKQTTDETKNT